ncbi:hypothetical protein L6452_45053 [Arctium lappa]|nr:hypothetical protein L6452_45053 [Arctium lappa]
MGTGDQSPAPNDTHPHWEAWVGGDAMRDAQADVPSAEWLRAQLAFKNSMVHGILQFTQVSHLLRSSSMREPRYPLPRVVYGFDNDPSAGLGNLRACCLLGCGSRFSGSLSESNPNSPSPVTTIVGHYPTIES